MQTKKAALKPLAKSIVRTSARMGNPFSSSLGLNATDTQLIIEKGLLPEDLEKLNELLLNHAYADLEAHDKVAALVARNTTHIIDASDYRDILTCEEIRAGLSVNGVRDLPAAEEIERACRQTLGLPSVKWQGKVRFDLSVCSKSTDLKQARQSALNGTREVVMKVLIGRLDALDELVIASAQEAEKTK